MYKIIQYIGYNILYGSLVAYKQFIKFKKYT